ncbi:hypothetical protein FKN01_04095 [Streptomyces sp. 130]|uniref:hypothetical protein n=1 Tax=Streptomyces sp. 130 TaxID=2591006 RepID=UPI00117D1F7B|nr:hypothetical protein [Streptomyces sp. 130]TRV80936.1 hypothetical protein FKN01_04095 [Streptomyces sp. 130]
MNGAESDVTGVAGMMPLFPRTIPAAVDEGPAGAAPRNNLARDAYDGRRFAKARPPRTDPDRSAGRWSPPRSRGSAASGAGGAADPGR